MTENNTPSPDEGKPEIETPTPNEEISETPETKPESTPSVEETPSNEPDYKTAYGESTREALLLRAQLKLKDERITELTKPHNPTEQELRQEYPEWDTMLPHEKRLAQNNLSIKRENATLRNEQAKMIAERQWEKDLKQALKKYPAIKGREDEFEVFVFKPTHQGVPVNVLAESFLFNTSTPPPPTPKAPTGERGSGGPKPENVVKKKYTIDELRYLRKNDPAKYREVIKSGDYEEDI